MVELTKSLEFGEYLSHTFPGFFSAISFFMLIDFWSPVNLTAWAIKDISGLISFTGFVLLAGTILGVILDGIRHSLIEDIIFSNFEGLRTTMDDLDQLLIKYNKNFSYYYYFNKIGQSASDAQAVLELLIKNVYRYVEFYGNTSISLVIFSFITPFYLYQVLYIPWKYSIALAIFSMMISGFCLYSSYEALKKYNEDKYSIISGYLDISKKPDSPKNDIGIINIY